MVVWKRVAPLVSGTFVGVGVALLENVRHCGGGLRGLITQTTSSDAFHFLLTVDPDVKLSAPSLAPCACHVCHGDKELNL